MGSMSEYNWTFLQNTGFSFESGMKTENSTKFGFGKAVCKVSHHYPQLLICTGQYIIYYILWYKYKDECLKEL